MHEPTKYIGRGYPDRPSGCGVGLAVKRDAKALCAEWCQARPLQSVESNTIRRLVYRGSL